MMESKASALGPLPKLKLWTPKSLLPKLKLWTPKSLLNYRFSKHIIFMIMQYEK